MHITTTTLFSYSIIGLGLSLAALLVATCLISQVRARALVTVEMLVDCPPTNNGLRETLTDEFSSQKKEIVQLHDARALALKIALGSALACSALSFFLGGF